MHQIFIAILLAVKGENEAMGATAIQFLGTVIDSPFVVDNPFDFSLQSAEGLLDLLDICFAGAFFELEGDYVTQFFLGAAGVGRTGRDGNGEKAPDQEAKQFHILAAMLSLFLHGWQATRKSAYSAHIFFAGLSAVNLILGIARCVKLWLAFPAERSLGLVTRRMCSSAP